MTLVFVVSCWKLLKCVVAYVLLASFLSKKYKKRVVQGCFVVKNELGLLLWMNWAFCSFIIIEYLIISMILLFCLFLHCDRWVLSIVKSLLFSC